MTSINNNRSLITFDKSFLFLPVIDRERSVAEYPIGRAVFLPPPPLVKSISSSAGSTVEVLIVWLRQLMARPSEATKGGNKNAMEGFIGYHWPLDAWTHSLTETFPLFVSFKYPWMETGLRELDQWKRENDLLRNAGENAAACTNRSGGRLNAFQSKIRNSKILSKRNLNLN